MPLWSILHCCQIGQNFWIYQNKAVFSWISFKVGNIQVEMKKGASLIAYFPCILNNLKMLQKKNYSTNFGLIFHPALGRYSFQQTLSLSSEFRKRTKFANLSNNSYLWTDICRPGIQTISKTWYERLNMQFLDLIDQMKQQSFFALISSWNRKKETLSVCDTQYTEYYIVWERIKSKYVWYNCIKVNEAVLLLQKC